mmetsp:Transcript_64912/g.120810  ORF Transcript_64912/g.120810 Transcript_64912/m.120810 type:complete len:126 (-) Transcript_64912:163-540(-)
MDSLLSTKSRMRCLQLLVLLGGGSRLSLAASTTTTTTTTVTMTAYNLTYTTTTTDMPWGWPWWAYFLLFFAITWYLIFCFGAGLGPVLCGTEQRTKAPAQRVTYEVVDEPDRQQGYSGMSVPLSR